MVVDVSFAVGACEYVQDFWPVELLELAVYGV